MSAAVAIDVEPGGMARLGCPACPCPDIPPGKLECPVCGADVAPLQRMAELASVLRNDALAMAAAKRWDEALASLGAAQQIAPHDAELHVLSAKVLWAAGRATEARFELQRSAARFTDNRDLKELLRHAEEKASPEPLQKAERDIQNPPQRLPLPGIVKSAPSAHGRVAIAFFLGVLVGSAQLSSCSERTEHSTVRGAR